MIDPMAGPAYQWGQRVRASQNLFNDGTFPEREPEELLVAEGDTGEIVQVGSHVETNTAVYLVEFAGNRIVGCFEQEIVPL